MLPMIDKVILYGAGGHCNVVVDILQTIGYFMKKLLMIISYHAFY